MGRVLGRVSFSVTWPDLILLARLAATLAECELEGKQPDKRCLATLRLSAALPSPPRLTLNSAADPIREAC